MAGVLTCRLCALLAVLSKHGSVNAAKFWSCGFDAQAIALLTSALPETIETLALEGSTLFDEASLASLASLPKVSALSLRCSELSGMPSPLAASLRTNETPSPRSHSSATPSATRALPRSAALCGRTRLC